MDLSAFFVTPTGIASIAAISSFTAALLGATIASRTSQKTNREKIRADLDLALKKFSEDQNKSLSDKAWVDYELRRDAYIEIARLIDVLYSGYVGTDNPEFHRAARRVRLVGSDKVVRALNSFTLAARVGQGADSLEALYRELFNAMRKDIRAFHTLPPEGTDLGPDAFPIES